MREREGDPNKGERGATTGGTVERGCVSVCVKYQIAGRGVGVAKTPLCSYNGGELQP